MDKQKRWNWQQDDWPQFRFDRAVLEAREARFLLCGGLLLGPSATSVRTIRALLPWT